MGHMRKRGQGTRRVFGAVVHGDDYPVPTGGSDSGGSVPPSTTDQAVAMLTDEAGGENDDGLEPPPEGEGDDSGVQPSKEDETQPSGQDLIAPYLEGLEGEVREVVEERLRKFQGDTDSNANRKIQDLSEKLSGFQNLAEDPEHLTPILDLYAWLMQDPKEALPWLVEALHSEQRVDLDELRDPLLEKLGIEQPPSGGRQPEGQQQPPQPNGDDPSRPLTRADLEEFFSRQQEEERRQQDEQRQREDSSKKLNTWVDDALDKFKLKERIPEDSPMRQFVFQQAHQLMQSGKVRNGRVAIESAVEQVAQFLGTQAVKGSDTPSTEGEGKRGAPRTASGGTGAQVPDQVDLKDKKSRVDLATSLLSASRSSEE